MPPSQLRERLTSMLDWLVEERFVRRCGPDEHFTPRWADGMMDENEAWDDTVPNWATSAHLTQGVSWEPNQPGAKPATQQSSAHGAPSFGFSRATSLQQTGGWVQPVAEDGPDMRYEATAMGERGLLQRHRRVGGGRCCLGSLFLWAHRRHFIQTGFRTCSPHARFGQHRYGGTGSQGLN